MQFLSNTKTCTFIDSFADQGRKDKLQDIMLIESNQDYLSDDMMKAYKSQNMYKAIMLYIMWITTMKLLIYIPHNP